MMISSRPAACAGRGRQGRAAPPTAMPMPDRDDRHRVERLARRSSKASTGRFPRRAGSVPRRMRGEAVAGAWAMETPGDGHAAPQTSRDQRGESGTRRTARRRLRGAGGRRLHLRRRPRVRRAIGRSIRKVTRITAETSSNGHRFHHDQIAPALMALERISRSEGRCRKNTFSMNDRRPAEGRMQPDDREQPRTARLRSAWRRISLRTG